MASEFIWRGPEEARQAIAAMQLQAALAENQSRENIAREQTAAQRYATQSQIADRDKDRAVSREDIASRAGYAKNTGADAAARERAKLQFDTVIQALKDSSDDPPTTSELDALLSRAPDLTEDQRKAAHTVRLGHVKNAKANAVIGKQAADNYIAELKGKAPTDAALPDIYKRMANDGSVIFDRATGQVRSAFLPPREDPPSGSGTRTIDDVKLEMGKQRNGVRSLVGALPPTQSSITAMPSPGFTPRQTDFSVSPVQLPAAAPLRMADMAAPPVTSFDTAPPEPNFSGGRPTMSGIRNLISRIPMIPMSRAIRVSDIAAPQPASVAPPSFSSGWFTVPPELAPPSESAAAPAENRLLQILSNMPEFARLPPQGKQMVLDQVTGGLMAMPNPTPPRVSDFQTIRPEFIPQDPGYYVAPQ